MNPAAPDDGTLMQRYADGDIAAFETLYRRHSDAVFRYLLRLSGHAPTAEDVFQEVWGKVIGARRRYRPSARFTTYLFRIAHNCFVDHLRRNRRHVHPGAVEADTQPATDALPDELAERALRERRLAAALAELPEAQREVFLLRQEAGLDLGEIAAVTDCNRETAKSRLRYAVDKLRAALADTVEAP